MSHNHLSCIVGRGLQSDSWSTLLANLILVTFLSLLCYGYLVPEKVEGQMFQKYSERDKETSDIFMCIIASKV